MLRCFILCCLLIGGLSLTAQTTAAKPACAVTQCQKATTATPACQAKTTQVAAVSKPAPDRASEASSNSPMPLFNFTSAAQANCQPTNCLKAGEPKSCEPANCTPRTSSTATRTNVLAVKQE